MIRQEQRVPTIRKRTGFRRGRNADDDHWQRARKIAAGRVRERANLRNRRSVAGMAAPGHRGGESAWWLEIRRRPALMRRISLDQTRRKAGRDGRSVGMALTNQPQRRTSIPRRGLMKTRVKRRTARSGGSGQFCPLSVGWDCTAMLATRWHARLIRTRQVRVQGRQARAKRRHGGLRQPQRQNDQHRKKALSSQRGGNFHGESKLRCSRRPCKRAKN